MLYPVMLCSKFTFEQAALVKANAKAARMRPATYIRACAIGQRLKPARAVTDAAMLKLLKKLGGMAAQLWKEGRTDQAEELRQGLLGIREAIERNYQNDN